MAMRAMRRLVLGLMALALAAVLATPVYAIECEGMALPGGCLFTITGGDTPYPDDGFAVTNADDVPMWDFVQQQDLQAIGYPISQRWTDGPFTLQAFQKVILQWDPGKQRVNWYNTLDALANKYPDVELPNVPAHQILKADQGATSFGVIMRNHLALLDASPKIKAVFLAEPGWLNLYGLPIRYEEREINGNPQGLQVLRAQRTVFAIWNVPAPGTTIGSVVLQNVPDKIKRLTEVIIPESAKVPTNLKSEETPIEPQPTTPTIAPDPDSDLDRYYHRAILGIAGSPAAFAGLASQPWFPDHITDREKAWITALQIHGSFWRFKWSIDQYYIDHRTISLPDSHDVDIWIIKENPIDPQNTLLDRAEDFLRISEEFFGIPFPTSHLIIMIPGENHRVRLPNIGVAQHLGDYIFVHDNILWALEHGASTLLFQRRQRQQIPPRNQLGGGRRG